VEIEMISEIKIPKLGENADTVNVTEVHVKAGDSVEKDQLLIVVNADKSTADVRAPLSGKVLELKVKVGDEIKAGTVYCRIEASNGVAAAPPVAVPAPTLQMTAQARKNEATEEPTPSEVRAIRAEVAAVLHKEAPSGLIAASPGTRWLARKLGVDLSAVRGTGAKGRITEEDVKSAYSGGSISIAPAGGGVSIPPMPRFEDYGDVQRDPLTHVRKLTAQKMSLSWSMIPHVTQHDNADITDLEEFRKQQEARLKTVKLTSLAFVMKAVVAALKQFPTFNSTLDLASNQLVLKKYYHIGIAVDTKAGLLVPVIRDVDKKGILELAKELSETGEKARSGKADMKGGSFTITNLGGIGGTGFTPIVNWPEVAILGLSRSKLQPVVKDGAIVPRLLLPLSLSYDHRVIDGADAARFTRRVAEILENPWTMLM
jgi:pyruvate dehydrogenase E2 component (dihydrolipoamide acetyltransferase)